MKGVYRDPRYVTDYYKEFRLRERTKCFKTCSKCGETKLISKFPLDKKNLDGHLGICKSCKSLYYKEKYRRAEREIFRKK